MLRVLEAPLCLPRFHLPPPHTTRPLLPPPLRLLLPPQLRPLTLPPPNVAAPGARLVNRLGSPRLRFPLAAGVAVQVAAMQIVGHRPRLFLLLPHPLPRPQVFGVPPCPSPCLSEMGMHDPSARSMVS